MNNLQSTSIILPTYNERASVGTTLDGLITTLEKEGLTYEIIVVDDSSPDGTADLVRARDDDNVRVITRQRERGLATAVQRGFAEARGTTIVVMDADGQHPVSGVIPLIVAIQDGYDLAVGSRYINGGAIDDWSIPRRFVSEVAGRIAHLAVPPSRQLTDPMSGMFAVRREVVNSGSLCPVGYKILLEVLVRCNIETVAEVPISFSRRESGHSKLNAEQYLRFLEHLAALGLVSHGLDEHISPRRAIRIGEFISVGGFGVIVNLLVFILVMGTGTHYLLAGVAAFLSAVNSNFIGNWFITFNRPEGPVWHQYLKYHLVSVTGFVIYTASLMGMVELVATPALLANVVAVAMSGGWNYLGSEQVAFA